MKSRLFSLLLTLATGLACADGILYEPDWTADRSDLSGVSKLVETKPATVAPQFDNRLSLTLGGLIYERTQPDNFYAGVEIDLIQKLRSKHVSFGYHFFQKGRIHFIPFFNVGTAAIDIKETYMSLTKSWVKHYHRESFYVTPGFLYLYDFNSVFSGGIKITPMRLGQFKFQGDKYLFATFNASLPLYFRFSKIGDWQAGVEPIVSFQRILTPSKVHFDHDSFVGLKLLLGYQF